MKKMGKAALVFEKFKDKFPAQDYRVAKTIAMLRENAEEAKIRSISKNINSSGNNYAPVLSTDEKKLYFCGRGRKDNLGNEDIFESSYGMDDSGVPSLLKGINKRKGNEAPLSISPDNRVLVTYKNADLWYSSKNPDSSWNEPKPSFGHQHEGIC